MKFKNQKKSDWRNEETRYNDGAPNRTKRQNNDNRSRHSQRQSLRQLARAAGY